MRRSVRLLAPLVALLLTGSAHAVKARPAKSGAAGGPYLVILRHGESVANELGQFAGWRLGVGLTGSGRQMAVDVGKKLRGVRFGAAYSSSLERAKDTLTLALEGADQTGVPRAATRKLNERRYGVLEGKTADEANAKYGEPVVNAWRKQFDTAPPGGESMRQVQARAMSFIDGKVLAQLKKGKNVLLATHRHTMRAMAAQLEGLSDEAFRKLAPANVEPFVYQLRADGKLHRVDPAVLDAAP